MQKLIWNKTGCEFKADQVFLINSMCGRLFQNNAFLFWGGREGSLHMELIRNRYAKINPCHSLSGPLRQAGLNLAHDLAITLQPFL